jgi:UDP-glucose 4-epimerase
MSKVLVTGGAGFIGSHVTDKLVELGHEVIVIDNLSLGKKENINLKAKFHQADIRDLSAIKEYFSGVEAVFHLAAEPRLPLSIEDPVTTHEINVTGTLNVLEAARQAKVKKVIFSSSCAVYGDQELPVKETAVPLPKSPYGLHKLMGEQYMRLYADLFGVATVCLRYFNVYGPRKTVDGGYPMVIPIFLKQRAEGQKLTIVGDGEQTRDYVQVSDVVAANIAAQQSQVEKGEAINIGSARQISVNQIAGLIGGETINVPPRSGEMRFIEANISLAKEKLGWTPQVKFEEGLKQLM